MERHAKYRSQFGKCTVFGSHHFHAVLDDEGNLSLHDTDADRVEWRVEFFLEQNSMRETRCPRISMNADVLTCSTLFLNEADVIRVPSPVFFGSPIEPDNYGMWLIMGLPSARAFLQSERDAKYLCWIRSDWQRQLLHFMGIRDEQVVIQDAWRMYACPSLSMHQYSHIDVTPTPSDQDIFREIRERCAPVGSSPERLFVSRQSITQKVGYRGLQNENELSEALESRGFVTVEPEKLSFPTKFVYSRWRR